MSLNTEYLRHKKREKDLIDMIKKLSQFIENTIIELTPNDFIKRQEMFEKFIKYMSSPISDTLEECENE